MELIQNTIETNPKLKWLKPQTTSETWNKSQINTTNGNRYFIKPFNETIRGTHPDIYICDDILRNEDITQEQAKDAFWSLIFPTINTRKAQLIVVGTPMTTDDLLSDLSNLATAKEGDALYELHNLCLKSGLLPIISKHEAVITDKTGNWVEPLWKENFNLDELRAMRGLIGGLRFDREYMCNPHAGGSSIFTEEMLKNRHTMELNHARQGYYYYCGCDIAISENNTADWSSYVVLEMDKEKHIQEVKVERYQGKGTSWQIKRIEQLNSAFNFRKILIESRGLSLGMVKDMLNHPELKMITEGFDTSRKGKELLISWIETTLSSKQLKILDNPVRVSELRNFGIKKDKSGKTTYEALGGHDDTVIALGLAIEAALSSGSGNAGFSTLMENEPMEYDDKFEKVRPCPYCGSDLAQNEKSWFCDVCNTEFSNL
jgi:hypothetical protein